MAENHPLVGRVSILYHTVQSNQKWHISSYLQYSTEPITCQDMEPGHGLGQSQQMFPYSDTLQYVAMQHMM